MKKVKKTKGQEELFIVAERTHLAISSLVIAPIVASYTAGKALIEIGWVKPENVTYVHPLIIIFGPLVIWGITFLTSIKAIDQTKKKYNARFDRVLEIGSEGLYYAGLKLLQNQKGGFQFHLNGLAKEPSSKYHRQGLENQMDQVVYLIRQLKQLGSNDRHQIAELTLGDLRSAQSKVPRSNRALWYSLSHEYCDRISRAEQPDPTPSIC